MPDNAPSASSSASLSTQDNAATSLSAEGEKDNRKTVARLLFGASTVFFITGIAGALVYARRARAKMLAEEQANASSSASLPAPAPVPRVETPTVQPGTTAAQAQPLVLPSRTSSSSSRLALPRRPTRAAPTSALSLSPLHALGAFGLATVGVVGLVAGTVGGVRWMMGVRDMDEFTVKARGLLASVWPGLGERIRRPTSPLEDGLLRTSLGAEVGPLAPDRREMPGGEEDGGEWTFAAAQARMSEAYDQGGLEGWGTQVGRELEKERYGEIRQRESRERRRTRDEGVGRR